ncbi:MAG TPA: PQQ-binding-like beta-propeller repeat protein [Bryobacteraceae bacterium]|nr:PQQ-binding-like beta-propeller repeat protein [Bryobacteraceae bacterium]
MRWLGWLLLQVVLAAADWTQFRGPNGSGVSPSKGLPDHFDLQKNIMWRTALPPGHSSPVFTADHIFVTAFEGKTLLTICLDRASGKVLWRREAPREREESFEPTNGPASPSPVTDGANVYVFFGDFGLLSYGTGGTERWRLPLGPFNNVNGHGSSPILADGRLVLICDQDTGSYLLAVDAPSGRVLWKTMRPEYTRGYATPAVYRPKNGPAELIVPGSFEVASYAIETGEKLWWVRGLAWQLKTVPLIDRDRIFVTGWETEGDREAAKVPEFAKVLAEYDKDHDGKLARTELPTKFDAEWFGDSDLNHDGYIDEREWQFYQARHVSQNCLVAIRGGGRGDVTNSHVLWRYRKAIPNTSSPLLYEGVIYLIRDGIFTSLNPDNGTVFKQARLSGALGRYWSSPIAADGRIFVVSEDGKVVVLRAAAEWEILAVNNIDEDTFATPAILDGRIYVRTRLALYCFAKRGT